MVRRQRTGIVAAPQGGARAEARLQALDLLAAAGLKRWGRWHRGDRRRGQRGDAALLGLAATGSLVFLFLFSFNSPSSVLIQFCSFLFSFFFIHGHPFFSSSLSCSFPRGARGDGLSATQLGDGRDGCWRRGLEETAVLGLRWRWPGLSTKVATGWRREEVGWAASCLGPWAEIDSGQGEYGIGLGIFGYLVMVVKV
ncbi:hypothetical protein M0R45_026236 [Rubus argutus]|uniref:Uncharacterized protein n=1 Tax=Rubus argutus TaxID=59490 RepID=A0AAW1WZH8_RUBAR